MRIVEEAFDCQVTPDVDPQSATAQVLLRRAERRARRRIDEGVAQVGQRLLPEGAARHDAGALQQGPTAARLVERSRAEAARQVLVKLEFGMQTRQELPAEADPAATALVGGKLGAGPPPVAVVLAEEKAFDVETLAGEMLRQAQVH